MYKDPFTGLYHTHYRDYDPIHNRWLSEDPFGYQDGLNLYCAYMGIDHRDVLGASIDPKTLEEIRGYLTNDVVQPAQRKARHGVDAMNRLRLRHAYDIPRRKAPVLYSQGGSLKANMSNLDSMNIKSKLNTASPTMVTKVLLDLDKKLSQPLSPTMNMVSKVGGTVGFIYSFHQINRDIDYNLSVLYSHKYSFGAKFDAAYGTAVPVSNILLTTASFVGTQGSKALATKANLVIALPTTAYDVIKVGTTSADLAKDLDQAELSTSRYFAKLRSLSIEQLSKIPTEEAYEVLYQSVRSYIADEILLKINTSHSGLNNMPMYYHMELKNYALNKAEEIINNGGALLKSFNTHSAPMPSTLR
jgi:hypothetical protein